MILHMSVSSVLHWSLLITKEERYKNEQPRNTGTKMSASFLVYPSWATFVKTIPEPQGNKKKYFAKAQEACRKDVERAFGVLQSRFAIVRGPARLWDEESLGNIMRACIIMHNMIVEDERDEYTDEYDCDYDDMGAKVTVSHNEAPELEAFIQNYKNIKNKETHTRLQADLIEHLWNYHPDLYSLD